MIPAHFKDICRFGFMGSPECVKLWWGQADMSGGIAVGKGNAAARQGM